MKALLKALMLLYKGCIKHEYVGSRMVPRVTSSSKTNDCLIDGRYFFVNWTYLLYGIFI